MLNDVHQLVQLNEMREFTENPAADNFRVHPRILLVLTRNWWSSKIFPINASVYAHAREAHISKQQVVWLCRMKRNAGYPSAGYSEVCCEMFLYQCEWENILHVALYCFVEMKTQQKSYKTTRRHVLRDINKVRPRTGHKGPEGE